MRKAIQFSVLAALAILAGGCEAITNKTLQPVLATNNVPASYQTNVVLVTNVVFLPATNAEPAKLVTQLQPVETVTLLPARTVVVTNGWEVRPEAQAAVGVASTVANVAQPGAGALVGAVGSGLLAMLAGWKNRQHRKTLDALVATVKGVEDYRRQLLATDAGQELDKKALPLLAEQHDRLGTASHRILEHVLNRYTGTTKL
jgi:hypothetical protein